MSKEWIVGWGDGLTGPTTSTGTPFCGGPKWQYIPVSQGMRTIALVPAQDGSTGIVAMNKNARLISAAPQLLEALQDIMDTGFAGGPQGKRARAAIKKATGE